VKKDITIATSGGNRTFVFTPDTEKITVKKSIVISSKNYSVPGNSLPSLIPKYIADFPTATFETTSSLYDNKIILVILVPLLQGHQHLRYTGQCAFSGADYSGTGLINSWYFDITLIPQYL